MGYEKSETVFQLNKSPYPSCVIYEGASVRKCTLARPERT